MSSNQPQASLPYEIVEHIFEDLDSNDPQSLQNCAVVCRSYLLLARTYIFRDVTISLEPITLVDFGDQSHQQPRLLHFLASDAHVSSNVRSLCIQRALPRSNDLLQNEWKATAKILRQILPKLDSLRRLSIHSSFLSDWTLEDDYLRQGLMTFLQLPTLRHLELSYMALFSEELSTLTRIPKVSLVGPYLIQESRTSTETSDGDSSTLCDLSVTFRTLASMDVIYATYSMAQCASKTLKSLTWLSDPYYDVQDVAYLSVLNLAHFSALSQLTITLSLGDQNCLTNLAGCIKTATGSSCLKTLEILCVYGGSRYSDDSLNSLCGWKDLDEVLTNHAYIDFQAVKIGVTVAKRTIPQTSKHGQIQQAIFTAFQRNLPQARSKGIIVTLSDEMHARSEAPHMHRSLKRT